MDVEDIGAAWWREFEFDEQEADRWEIGNLNLWLGRAATEWRLAHQWVDKDREHWRRERHVAFPGEGVSSERFAMSQTDSTVRLRAMTADRNVVVRPRLPLRVPSGQQAKIFISSPLSIGVSVGEQATFLRELPTRRLSKTWFGPSTREGELAYVLKTEARTVLTDLLVRPHRMVTPILIENRAEDTLEVERLSLPVPRLSLFGTSGGLWSEAVRLLREEPGSLAQLDITPGPPSEAQDAVELGEPRESSNSRYLFRAFSSILSLTEMPT